MECHTTQPLKHDYHDYGVVISPINGGKFDSEARFAVVELDSDEDGFFLECKTQDEAERELRDHVEFIVADGF